MSKAFKGAFQQTTGSYTRHGEEMNIDDQVKIGVTVLLHGPTTR
jgi:hypothetical protein